ncbi:carbohydrate sulfotransferase 10-like isoform X1 [Syngnathus acus]|uniref:carbohydrate sulfotransferase 10-like isoform X1 n=2 Tax=Syngnathus acus TaxID=161584 RepID=UPI001886091B|nr:carbohydrate sulfotransferase 10-like isoform X1 [Syngnathus acus]XP_037131849.1 carbohydrate sulfotransferase 10-like isoform X1 [Syngnathus acus]XP_037131856.1 carbohydrate sulfotransferase 10-like isoform X1 [Syngnathus acus]XP_037131864.1 carbohydrate sulfotransferase 10-like isoform X1 [Syngnathus acus]XP_037131871.1 carbohydrate sulfotransferase 10-like isoform X1 [Syngnathus acus]
MQFRWRIFLACFWLLIVLTVIDKLISLRDAKEIEIIIQDHSFDQSAGADWKMVVEQRTQWLSDMCKSKKLWNDTHVSNMALDNIFVLERHNILFCQTPDGSNDEWKKFLLVLSGTYSSMEEVPEDVVRNHEKSLPRLSSLTSDEITHRLKNDFKFFIVRDPFERLISTFEDKFLFTKPSEPWYKYTIGPAIIRKYRKDFPYLNEYGLHFDEFVHYLVDEVGRKSMDWRFGQHVAHWASYVELCAPCDISYDVIGHLETLKQDAALILRRTGIEQLIFPAIAHYNKSVVERYFSGISKSDLRRLYARYQGDFHLFGYRTPELLFN